MDRGAPSLRSSRSSSCKASFHFAARAHVQATTPAGTPGGQQQRSREAALARRGSGRVITTNARALPSHQHSAAAASPAPVASTHIGSREAPPGAVQTALWDREPGRTHESAAALVGWRHAAAHAARNVRQAAVLDQQREPLLHNSAGAAAAVRQLVHARSGIPAATPVAAETSCCCCCCCARPATSSCRSSSSTRHSSSSP